MDWKKWLDKVQYDLDEYKRVSASWKVCKQQCKASPDRSYCLGCLRTMQEIIDCGKTKKDSS